MGRIPSVRGAVRAVEPSARHAKRTPLTGQVSRIELHRRRGELGVTQCVTREHTSLQVALPRGGSR
jgi:hypothetical protein